MASINVACPGSRATPKATGRYHRATMLRIAPSAAKATNNKTTMKNTPTLLAVLMAIACAGKISRASPDGGGPGLS